MTTPKIVRTKTIVSWVLVVIWAIFIFFMSAHTGNDLDSGSGLIGWIKQHLTQFAEELFGPGTDAVSVTAHFLEYVVFGILLTVAIAWTYRYRLYQSEIHTTNLRKYIYISVAIAIIAASIYGITDEFHQAFVPGRVCDPFDWLTDTIGAAVGAIMAAFVYLKLGNFSK